VRRVLVLALAMLSMVARAEDAHVADSLPSSAFMAQIQKSADGRDHAYLTDAQNNRYDLGPVYTIGAGTTLYHWGSDEEIQKLACNPEFNTNNMKYRMLHPVHGGGGFYLSADDIDSEGYGPSAIVYTLPKDVRAIHMEETEYLIGKLMMPEGDVEIAPIEVALRAAGIGAIKEDIESNWNCFFDPDVLVTGQIMDVKTVLSVKRDRGHVLSLLYKLDEHGDSFDGLEAAQWPEFYDLFVKHKVTAHDKAYLKSAMKTAILDIYGGETPKTYAGRVLLPLWLGARK
jgi:hypothetical protein